jgi:hypothetical protein
MPELTFDLTNNSCLIACIVSIIPNKNTLLRASVFQDQALGTGRKGCLQVSYVHNLKNWQFGQEALIRSIRPRGFDQRQVDTEAEIY